MDVIRPQHRESYRRIRLREILLVLLLYYSGIER